MSPFLSLSARFAPEVQGKAEAPTKLPGWSPAISPLQSRASSDRPPAVRPNHWEAYLPVADTEAHPNLSPAPWNLNSRTLWLRVALGQLLFGVDTLFSWLAGTGISEVNGTLIYLVGCVLAAMYLGRIPALVISFESLVMLSEIHKMYPLGPHDLWQYPLSFSLFLFTIHQIALLSDRARSEAWRGRQKGEIWELLGEFVQLCAEANTLDHVRELLLHVVGVQLGHPVAHQEEPGERDVSIPIVGAAQPHGWLVPRGQLDAFSSTLVADLAHLAGLTMDRIQQAENEHRTSMLEATQKLQSALINSLSHDLQTPLASILGVFEALQSPQAQLSSQQSSRLTSLGQQQSERLLRLVRNLLNIGKLEAGALKLSLQWLVLEDVVRSAIRSFPEADIRRIQLSSEGSEVEVRGDASLLSQIVLNLIDNALKFSPSQEAVQLNLGREKDSVHLEVLDRGFGIQEQDTVHIFERFFRGSTPKKVPGSGLGLHICKLLVDLHGGQLDYSPRAEGGSCFRLTLPGKKEELTP